jgi:hypothetical protein
MRGTNVAVEGMGAGMGADMVADDVRVLVGGRAPVPS